MRKSTFIIVVALVVALCVPAVAFAALSPSPQRVHHGAAPAAAVQQNDDRPAREGERGAQRGYHHSEGAQGVCDAFVDADGDGVCDHCAALADEAAADGDASVGDVAGNGAASGSCPAYADADGDGVCDNCAGADGSCPGFVDADGDGVCDNYGEGCPGDRGHGCQNGTADGAHHGRGHGCWR